MMMHRKKEKKFIIIKGITWVEGQI